MPWQQDAAEQAGFTNPPCIAAPGASAGPRHPPGRLMVQCVTGPCCLGPAGRAEGVSDYSFSRAQG